MHILDRLEAQLEQACKWYQFDPCRMVITTVYVNSG